MSQTAPPPTLNRRVPCPAARCRARRPRAFQPPALSSLGCCLDGCACRDLARRFWRKRLALSTAHAAGSLSAAGIVAALYLLGWRARDRAAGVSGGAAGGDQPAVSPDRRRFAPQCAVHAADPCRSVRLCRRVVSGRAGPGRRRDAGSPRRAAARLAAAGIVTGAAAKAGLAGRGDFSGARPRRLGRPNRDGPCVRCCSRPLASTPASGTGCGRPRRFCLLWFLLPLCAEMSEPMRRARWLPVIFWAVLYLASSSLLSFSTSAAMLLPLMPLLFALAGGGLSRLLPALSGEFPGPAPRYILATLAVLALSDCICGCKCQSSTSAAPAHHSRSGLGGPAGRPSSIRKLNPQTLPPSVSTNFAAASAVPPVASRSSTINTRWPG